MYLILSNCVDDSSGHIVRFENRDHKWEYACFGAFEHTGVDVVGADARGFYIYDRGLGKNKPTLLYPLNFISILKLSSKPIAPNFEAQ